MALPKSGGEVGSAQAVSRLIDNVLYIDVSIRLEPQNEWINLTVTPDLSHPQHVHTWTVRLFPRWLLRCHCGAEISDLTTYREHLG